MTSLSDRFAFSPDGADVALTTPDGRLVVFDVALRTLKNEFVPSSHLSAACVSLAWKPCEAEAASRPADAVTPKKGRKRKNSTASPLINGGNLSSPAASSPGGASSSTAAASAANDLIAVGTAAGSIVFYSLSLSAVKQTFSPAHEERVNDLTWNRTGTDLFSCSSDGYLGRLKKNAFSKFRPDGPQRRHKFHSVRLHPSDEKSLLVGAQANILWIDLDTQLPIRVFSAAHQGNVHVLEVFLAPGLAVDSTAVPYLVSGGDSDKDHVLSVWKLDRSTVDKKEAKSPKKTAQTTQTEAMFNLNEAARSVNMVQCNVDEDDDEDGKQAGTILIGSVTKTGVFHCFEFDANSKRKKNKATRPKLTVQVASEKDAKGRVVSIPILCSRLLPAKAASKKASSSLQLHLVQGTHVKPFFETLEYGKLDKLTCLVRRVDEEVAKPQIGTKAMVADTSNVSVLAPGPSMVARTSTGTKRKSSSTASGGRVVEELPMLERLRLLSKETEHMTSPPRTDSLLQLLLQGLHNQDRKILDSVLDRADDELIDKTVQKLPVEGVIPLIQELQHYIKGRGMVNSSHAKWLRSVLQHHTAYLMSNPHCEQLLSPVFAMLESRTRHYAPLVQLKGKLDIMTKQIMAKPEETNNLDTTKEALLVYQDDSSDELSDVLDELLLPASDTEEAWNLDEVENEDDEDEDEEDDSEDGDDSDIEMVNGNGLGEVEMESD